MPDIRLRTEPSGDAGQHIIVEFDGVEVIRSWGALPDITIDHLVTQLGIDAALGARSATAIDALSSGQK